MPRYLKGYRTLANLKLGKQRPRKDARTLKLSKYLRAMPAPPLSMGFVDAVRAWPMMLNDALGDCTIACAGHQIEQWTTYAQPPGFTPADPQILAAYEAVSGYNPNVPGSDQGAVVLDVLNYWRQTGIAGHRIAAYVEINPSIPRELELAVALFGSAYLGVQLPVSAQSPRIDPNGLPIWEVPPQGPVGGGSPGSWGGHAIPLVGYKSPALKNGGARVVSWGQLFDVTWNFLAAYCDEAYAIVTPDWIERSGKSPTGFNLAQLLADLAQVTDEVMYTSRMPANTTPAKIGRFQTRLSRVVDIVASRTVQEPVPGHPGKTASRRLWTGRLYRGDMKNVDSIFDWEDSGAFSNQRGVASPNDLSIFMRELTPEELALGRAAIPENLKGDDLKSFEDAATAAVDQPAGADDFRKRAAALK